MQRAQELLLATVAPRQRTHALVVMLATSGGTQNVQDVDPTLDTAPAGQIVHSVADEAPEVVRKVPAGQPVHAYALPSRNEPAMQKNDDGVGVDDPV